MIQDIYIETKELFEVPDTAEFTINLTQGDIVFDKTIKIKFD